MTATERMPPSDFLRSANFAELDRVNDLVNQRTNQLFAPQVRFQQLCAERGWWHTFYTHPGIPGAVFLCVRIGKRHYREFLGYNPDIRIARITAASKALRYYNQDPPLKRKRNELSSAQQRCLDVELDAIQAGIAAYRKAVQSDNNQATADQVARAAQQAVLLNNVEHFIRYEELRQQPQDNMNIELQGC